jgi:hypothetical protein
VVYQSLIEEEKRESVDRSSPLITAYIERNMNQGLVVISGDKRLKKSTHA